MGKKAKARQLPENVASATLRNLRVSPIKVNLVAGMIRGMHVSRALDVLKNSKRRISNDIQQLLLSAISNAENNHGLDVDSLIVDQCYVGKAMVLKRFHARGRGRSSKILKPFSHVTLTVKEVGAV